MSCLKAQLRCRLTGLVVGALLWAPALVAQTGNRASFSTNQALAITLLPGESVGNEQVMRGLIKTGTNEFMFVVPGLRVEAPREGKILLISPDLKWYVSMRIIQTLPPDSELKRALREHVMDQYPGARGVEEFASTVADREGCGLHLWQKPQGSGPRRVSILWVPFQAGVVEFCLNAESDSVSTSRAAFDMILLTFRSNERGKIEVLRRSDKS